MSARTKRPVPTYTATTLPPHAVKATTAKLNECSVIAYALETLPCDDLAAMIQELDLYRPTRYGVVARAMLAAGAKAAFKLTRAKRLTPAPSMGQGME